MRLGAEDGLAFASVSGSYALELVRWLQRMKPDIHVFFDTFPKKEDPGRGDWSGVVELVRVG